MERTTGLNDKCPRTGKVQFDTKEAAAAVRKKLRKSRGPKLAIYTCVHCGFIHLGHDRAPERRNRDSNGFCPTTGKLMYVSAPKAAAGKDHQPGSDTYICKYCHLWHNMKSK